MKCHCERSFPLHYRAGFTINPPIRDRPPQIPVETPRRGVSTWHIPDRRSPTWVRPAKAAAQRMQALRARLPPLNAGSTSGRKSPVHCSRHSGEWRWRQRTSRSIARGGGYFTFANTTHATANPTPEHQHTLPQYTSKTSPMVKNDRLPQCQIQISPSRLRT